MSKQFYISGVCKPGQDVLADWAYGNPIKGIGEGPWEKTPIKIIGAAIAFFSPPDDMRAAMLGNSASPDPMLWYGHGGHAGATTQFWAPYFFTFPAIGSLGKPHIDLHVGCGKPPWWRLWKQLKFNGSVTIYYLITS